MGVSAFKIGPDGRRYVRHDPVAKLDYTLMWRLQFPAGDPIVDSQWATPAGVVASAPGHSDVSAWVWLEAPGSQVGDSFEVSNTVTTIAGRRDRRTFRLEIRK